MSWDLVPLGIALAVSAIGAVTDVRSGRIPNALTLPAAAAGVALHAALGGMSRALVSVVGLLVTGLVPWFLHRATRGRAIGGGDVKLFAALGAIMGPVAGLEIEFSAFVILSLFAMVRLAFRGDLLRMLKNVLVLVLRPFLPQRWRRPLDAEAMTELRMGPAILAAVATASVAERAARWASWLV